ncbi:MAG: protein translocase subunit SecF [Sneathiellaceae bacterium]
MALVRLIRDDTSIPFMALRKAGPALAGLLALASLVLFFVPGLNYGIDFRGGIVVEVRTDGPADFAAMRSALTGLDLGDVALQEFGAPNEVLIRVESQDGKPGGQEAAVEALRNMLTAQFAGADIRRVESVGAEVSDELFIDGVTALLFAFVAMLVYIWFRFEWQFAVAAVGTLVLDALIGVGFFAVTNIPFNLSSVAALLTIIGYSINDKVVVFDRVRENLRKYKSMPLIDLLDKSVNDTLTRTIATSLTTFIAIAPLAIIGGESVAGFAMAMMFGVVVGTLSSIFVAAPLVHMMGDEQLRRGVQKEAEPEAGGARP